MLTAAIGEAQLDSRGLDDDSAGTVAIALETPVTPRISIGGRICRISTEHGNDVNTILVFAEGLLSLRPSERLEPYLSAGVGYGRLRGVTAGVEHADAGLAGEVGIGLRAWVGRRRNVGFVVDASGFVVDAFGERGLHWMASAGMALRLRRPR